MMDTPDNLPKNYQRWLDSDPALAKAVESLREATTSYQAQVALNIIKVIVEHQIQHETYEDIDDLVTQLQNAQITAKGHHRRWYDVNETLSSALTLLQECPEDLQAKIIPSVCATIEAALATA